ncbi:MAG: vancomycin high temperature exclusion protein, partial [Verrucomicrobiota bacterium]
MKLPKLLSTRGTGRLRFLVLPVLLLGMVLLAANFWIVHRGSRQLVQQFDRLPVRAVGLVLGTAPTLGKESRPNPFFEGRMETAARLYHAGKVRHLLLSGDHGRTHYNEPAAMR